MIVYAVTSGEYSDYGIECIFSSKDLAQEWIAKKKASTTYSEHFDIVTWTVDQERDAQVLEVWRCGIMLEDGEIKEIGSYTDLCAPFRGRVYQAEVKPPIYNGAPMARVESAVSREHAIKLAAEIRQKWLRHEKLEPEFADSV